MINKNLSAKVLERVLSKGGDWADLFCEETLSHRASLSDKVIKSVSQNLLYGAGLRLVHQHQEYYAYTNDLSEAALLKIADQLSCLINTSASLVSPFKTFKNQNLGPVLNSSWEEKLSLLKRADHAARAFSSLISQVNVDYFDEKQQVLVATSDGLYAEDERIRGRFSCTVVAQEGNERQMAYEAPGALKGFEFFETLEIEKMAQDLSESALKMLKAPYAPKGEMPVIIDSGFGGVIFHEACGHLLEASAIAKGASVMAGKLGEQIASSCVSAVDDGTLEGEWGSLKMDDEGRGTQRNLLIENGILKSYLVDRLNGERIGLKPTGSARRQSYRFAPTSRMNNTFILPGSHRLEEMISQTDHGLYAKRMGGGSVNPATGEFNFSTTEAYLIEKGKITTPVKGAVLIGRGEEILKKIDLVGSEFKMAQGMCGAASGWVPVNVGQPPLRVSQILVGGQG